MPYLVLPGAFHIHYPDIPKSGPEPDGDALKFKPDDPSLTELLRRPGTPAPDFNSRGMVNLRLEGIDALETHFRGGRQNLAFANAARDRLLELAGFGEVTFFDDLPNKVEKVENHPVRGVVLSNGLDGHGRLVSFVFPESILNRLGGARQVMLDEATMQKSFNARLLSEGHAWPMFYLTLPRPLREAMRTMAKAARARGAGFWPEAVGTSERPASVAGPNALPDLVIWPKLFRRLVAYFGMGFQDLSMFDAWLRLDPKDRDDRLLLPDDDDANMHNLIEVLDPATLRMRFPSMDVVVLPDDAVLSEPAFRTMRAAAALGLPTLAAPGAG